MDSKVMRRTAALSDHWLPRLLRGCRQEVRDFEIPPVPKVLAAPLLALFLALRSIYYFLLRVLLCEPFFKANCARYGQGVHTDVFFHWIQGRGELIVGDNVLIDGKCSFSFAARFSEHPTLIIGDNTGIGHACSFTIGKKIVIGRHCRIAGQVWIFDSPGHPADPIARMAGSPVADDEVRPVLIEDNVWIGSGAIIMPGVTIGQGSIVAAGAVVMVSVPPNTMVAGNPARQLRRLTGHE
jgi:acetyltransferase-like isoleucine patch superfamily enzyme